MTLSELVALIHKVQSGATVLITSTNVPNTNRGQLYGSVTIMHAGYTRTFHDEVELRNILEKGAQ